MAHMNRDDGNGGGSHAVRRGGSGGNDAEGGEGGNMGRFWASAPPVEAGGPAILVPTPTPTPVPSEVDIRRATRDASLQDAGDPATTENADAADAKHANPVSAEPGKDPPPDNPNSSRNSSSSGLSSTGIVCNEPSASGDHNGSRANGAGEESASASVPPPSPPPPVVYEFRVNRAPSGLSNGRRSPDPGMLLSTEPGSIGSSMARTNTDDGGSGSISAASSIASFYGDHAKVRPPSFLPYLPSFLPFHPPTLPFLPSRPSVLPSFVVVDSSSTPRARYGNLCFLWVAGMPTCRVTRRAFKQLC